MPRSKKLSASRRAPRAPRYQEQLMNEVRAAGRQLNDQASDVYNRKTTKGIPFAGSKTAAALSKAFEEPVEFIQEDLAEELSHDTGDCLNKLAYYDVNTGANNHALFEDMQVDDTNGFKNVDGITLSGTINLDERAVLMSSVGAAMVVCKILHNVPSKKFTGPEGTEMKLIQLEDIIEYIHDRHGDVITLDRTSSAAFERMTREQRRNHERHLLKEILTDITTGDENDIEAAPGTDPEIRHYFYTEKIRAMTIVKADSVGKTWATDENGGVHGRSRYAVEDNPPAHNGNVNDERWYRRLMLDTLKVIKGSPRIKISSNLKIQQANGPTVQAKAMDIAVVILSLVALHVMSYANTAALDFYYKLAIKGGQTGPNEVEFDTPHNNDMLTHSVYAPGLIAALKMYGISENDFDEEMALQINTNKNVKELFRAAHKAYDTEGPTKVGAKMFTTAVDTTPAWLIPKEERLKYQREFARTAGRTPRIPVAINPTGQAGAARAFGAADISTSGVGGIVDNLSQSVANHYATRGMQGRVNRIVGGMSAFGSARRRRRRSSSFGSRKVRSSKKKSKKTKKASFGRRRK